MIPMFDHEKLRVYQQSLAFVTWATDLLEEVPAQAAAKDQLDRASTSVPLNLAEGNAKWSAADRGRYLRSASGSALECAACLDVLVAKRLATPERVQEGKMLLQGVVAMLGGLMNETSSRLNEMPE